MTNILKKLAKKLVDFFRWVQKETDDRRTRFLLKGMVRRREDDGHSGT